jgi:LysM repeat protein
VILHADTASGELSCERGNRVRKRGGIKQMARTLLSVVTVVLLAVAAFYLYTTSFGVPKAQPATLDESRPPAAPAKLEPAPGPIVQPLPQVELPKPAISVPAPKVEPQKPAAPAKRTHVVQAGDSLWSISKQYYGTPDLHRRIAEMNKLGAKDRIRTGQVLVIPDLPLTPVAEKAAAAPAATPAPAPAEEHVSSNESAPVVEPMPPTLNTVRPRP